MTPANAIHVLIILGMAAGALVLFMRRQRPSSRPSPARAITPDQLAIEQRIAVEGPSLAVAYMLWLFLGLVSGHRFYLRRPGSAILQILSYLALIGFIWWILDGFRLPGMLRESQSRLRASLQA